MERLIDIPFTIDIASLLREAHVEAGSSDAEELQDMVDLAMQVGKPKAAYTESFVEHRDGDVLQIDGVSFASRMLSRNLESVERVFPHVATCGREMDEAAPVQGDMMDEASPVQGDMLKEFWWDLIKARLHGTASKHLSDQVHGRFRLGQTATMHPGSADAVIWPIEQQRELFALLGDVEESIGVRLTESFLMVPNKSTSGILFPTESDFRSCEVCHREGCPSRHAPFNEELWEELQHD